MTRGLRLEIKRSAERNGASWEVSVTDGRNHGENLLYHSRQWHGPYPTMIDPWMVRDHLFPSRNRFNVRGYPWLISVECRDCAVEGDGPATHFVRGTIRVTWSRR